MIAAAALLVCTVTDGDTIRCGNERVRLIGIDAPELPGHCRPGRQCARGNGAASRAELERLIGGRPVRLERHGYDRYGRTLAFAWAGRVNLSCAMIRARRANYVPRWDFRGQVLLCARNGVSNARLGKE